MSSQKIRDMGFYDLKSTFTATKNTKILLLQLRHQGLILTCITDLMTPLSVLILAFFRGLTEGPTQVMKANLDRLLISSPVSIRTKPKARSSSTNNRNDHLLGL